MSLLLLSRCGGAGGHGGHHCCRLIVVGLGDVMDDVINIISLWWGWGTWGMMTLSSSRCGEAGGREG